VKFKFSCPAPTAEWSDIGVYWLDSAGNAASDRAFTFKAKPGWQVVPLGELVKYHGNIGGLRLDMESIDTCKTYSFEDIEFYNWKVGHQPFIPRLPMPWSDGAPRKLLERLHATMSAYGLTGVTMSPEQLSDVNWKNGVWVQKDGRNGFFITADAGKVKVSTGTKLSFAKSGERVVTDIALSPPYINIFVDMPLDPEGDGFPNKVIISNPSHP
jgi:hypothetical protein